MLNESQWTSKLLKHLRAAMPEAVVWKHSDRISAGLPDFSVSRFDGVSPYARTTWVEVKLVDSPRVMFKPIQIEVLRQLGGYYIVWSPKLKRGWLFRADERENWHTGQQHTFGELVDRIVRFF